MRLIDADVFERDLNEKVLPVLIKRYGAKEVLNGLHFSFSDLILNIQGQPTVKAK